MATPELWQRFSLDPRHPQHAHMRASDRDRDVVHEVLGAAYADGRLSAEEHDERSDAVAHAKTLGELPAYVADLVAATTLGALPATDLRAEAERRYRSQRQNALMSFLVPTLICWVIWAATMFGEFAWPVFVTVGTGLGWLRLVTSREDSITAIQHQLERKERRRVEAREKAARRSLPPGAPPSYPPPPQPPTAP